MVLSKHGRAVAVVVPVGEYEDLVEAAERSVLQHAVDEAERELESGQGIPHKVVRERLMAMTQGSK